MNYYRRYIGDYGRDTTLLSLAEHGAYALLLDHYYASEGPLPLDQDDIYRIARAVKPDERRSVDSVLRKYFAQEADGFHNSRADSELDRARPAILAARENGGKGGRPKNPLGYEPETHRDSYEENPVGYCTPGESEPTGKAIRAGDPTTNHQPPTTNHQPPEKRSRKRDKFALPENFQISERVRAWAEKKGFTKLEEHLEAFQRKATMNAYSYANWDDAFMEAIREDWAKIRSGNAGTQPRQSLAESLAEDERTKVLRVAL